LLDYAELDINEDKYDLDEEEDLDKTRKKEIMKYELDINFEVLIKFALILRWLKSSSYFLL
jgi:hypothetical protein